jgi:hypothetical protein
MTIVYVGAGMYAADVWHDNTLAALMQLGNDVVPLSTYTSDAHQRDGGG